MAVGGVSGAPQETDIGNVTDETLTISPGNFNYKLGTHKH